MDIGRLFKELEDVPGDSDSDDTKRKSNVG